MAFRLKYHSIFIYLFFVILTNCQFNEATNTHGILFLENRSDKLIVKKTNKNDVINIIGYPHSKSISNENEWIYIERVLTKGEYHKLGQNILKSNNVLYLVFDKYGVLENKELFKKEQINKIVFSKKETTNDLSKKSFIEGLFSSLKSKMYRRK
jgi:outer membrane protein assembly factor BamE (lipoprotein component of BamABCDE complex)